MAKRRYSPERRVQSKDIVAARNALRIAAEENEFFTSEAIRYHLNGSIQEYSLCRVVGSAILCAVSDKIIEKTNDTVCVHRLEGPGGTRKERRMQTVWKSLIFKDN